ncbi:hypothetical protein HDV06_002251 [Boothiomyces sp. JEL0866]|nr:hypothetical protein HDV06_002251 [Boothiomyces sp. JEL0866]
MKFSTLLSTALAANNGNKNVTQYTLANIAKVEIPDSVLSSVVVEGVYIEKDSKVHSLNTDL